MAFPRFVQDGRLDRVFRFITVVFMEQDGLLEILQDQFGTYPVVGQMRLSEKDRNIWNASANSWTPMWYGLRGPWSQPSRFLLRGNYGSRVEERFGLNTAGSTVEVPEALQRPLRGVLRSAALHPRSNWARSTVRTR